MPNWEYKVITSGSLGFASLALLEQHLNQLGKEEWEVIHFQTRPDNPLAFQGLARRPVMRDWVVEAAPPSGSPTTRSGAVPAPPEERPADALSVSELRAEAEGRRESLLAREESLRPVHGAADDEPADEPEDLDDLDADDDLPTFFEAIRPHMRRNQRGPGMAVGVDYLAKKFEQTEPDLIEALKECGFTIPASAKDQPVYLEYDGDLYWLNRNHRGQLWVNTREKPRAVFKPASGKPVRPEAAPEGGGPREREPEAPSGEPASGESAGADARPEPGAGGPEPRAPNSEPPAELPAGPALLDRLRPMMRRNRRGSGLSGSMSYLGRALRTDPKTLEAAFAPLSLVLSAQPEDKPVFVEIGAFVYWLNRDKTGQIWINARLKRESGEEPPPAPAPAPPSELPLAPEAEPATPSAEPPPPPSPLAAVRLLLKETKRGGVAAEVGRVAEQLGRPVEELLAVLVGAGLQVPEKARSKPVFAEHAGEIFWLNRNAKDELWLNAKASKFAGKTADGEASSAPAEGSSPDESTAATKPNRSRRK